jgi:hypothetical protein
MITVISAQTIPPLPVPVATGTAEVWNDSLYYFGGTGDWNGTVRYPRIYKFDGAAWSYHDSIPDYAVWDVKSVRVGDKVYLLSGWPSGGHRIRCYNLFSGTWTYLSSSPNQRTWGTTAEHVNGFIYLISPSGNVSVYEYDIGRDTWASKAQNPVAGSFGLSSAVYQDEIYVVGFENNEFFKYTPGSDSWNQLADTPYQIVACAAAVLDDKLYCVGGGNDEEPFQPYNSILVYDIPADSWQIDSFSLSNKRQWLTDAGYQGKLYVLGGFDSTWSAVDVVEEIVLPGPISLGIMGTEGIPSEFSLSQNYPNPFNPITSINYRIPEKSQVELIVYNMLGKKVRTLMRQHQVAGNYQVQWNGRDDYGNDMASGMYVYRITYTPQVSPLEGGFRGVSETHKMLLVR